MTSKCLTAYTTSEPIFPAFVNFTIRDNRVIVIVRNHPTISDNETTCGSTSEINIRVDTFKLLLKEALRNIDEY